MTGFSADEIKVKCNGADHTAFRFTDPVTLTTPINLNSDDSFGIAFSDNFDKPTYKGKVFGIKLSDNPYKGLYKEKDFFDRQFNPKANGPVVCKSGDVLFKVTRAGPKSSGSAAYRAPRRLIVSADT